MRPLDRRSDRSGPLWYRLRPIPVPASAIAFASCVLGSALASTGSALASTGSVPASIGSVPTSTGSVPASIGSVPASNGSVPASNGSVPASIGSAPAFLGFVVLQYRLGREGENTHEDDRYRDRDHREAENPPAVDESCDRDDQPTEEQVESDQNESGTDRTAPGRDGRVGIAIGVEAGPGDQQDGCNRVRRESALDRVARDDVPAEGTQARAEDEDSEEVEPPDRSPAGLPVGATCVQAVGATFVVSVGATRSLVLGNLVGPVGLVVGPVSLPVGIAPGPGRRRLRWIGPGHGGFETGGGAPA